MFALYESLYIILCGAIATATAAGAGAGGEIFAGICFGVGNHPKRKIEEGKFDGRCYSQNTESKRKNKKKKIKREPEVEKNGNTKLYGFHCHTGTLTRAFLWFR